MDSDANKQTNSQALQPTDADGEAEQTVTSAADEQPTTVAVSEINEEATTPSTDAEKR